MFLVRWFYEGSEPSSACNRERIQLVDNQYAPKALSNDKLQQEEGTVATMVALFPNVIVLPSLKKKDDDVASYCIAKGLCKALFLRKSDLESDFSKE